MDRVSIVATVLMTLSAAVPTAALDGGGVPGQGPTGSQPVADVRHPTDGTDEPQQTTTSAKTFNVEVVPNPEAQAPGGTVRLRFLVFNAEETDERVRLRVAGAQGWKLRSEDGAREWLVEAGDVIEGDVYLSVPDDATIGTRQLIRFLVEVPGEPGVVEAQTYIAVIQRGRRPDALTVTGTSTLGVSRVAPSRDAQSMNAIDLSTTFGDGSSVSFSLQQGMLDTLSNYRYDVDPLQISGDARHGGWEFTFGNRVPSIGNALTGPFVQGIGVGLQRPTGRLVADLVVAQPAQFRGDAAGHLIRGRAGLRGARGLVALTVSDFGRPDGGYTTLPSVPQVPLDAEAEEQWEIERAFAGRAPSNRVQGVGLDLEVRPARGHRLTARSGTVRQSNAAGNTVRSLVGETTYSLSIPRTATLNLRWREMPQTLPGIYIPGDEKTADGGVHLTGSLRLVGRVFQISSETAGGTVRSRGEGGSVGMQFQRHNRRIEARWNYRETDFTQRTIRRTVSLNGGLPIGAVRVSANADVGVQDNGRTVTPVRYYRGDLRWTGAAGSLSVDGASAESGGKRQGRLDVITSLNVRKWELAGGAWATNGWTSGGEPGMWASVGAPLGREVLIVLGVDRASTDWVSPPEWRGTFAVRKRFSVPLPFSVRPISP